MIPMWSNRESLTPMALCVVARDLLWSLYAEHPSLAYDLDRAAKRTFISTFRAELRQPARSPNNRHSAANSPLIPPPAPRTALGGTANDDCNVSFAEGKAWLPTGELGALPPPNSAQLSRWSPLLLRSKPDEYSNICDLCRPGVKLRCRAQRNRASRVPWLQQKTTFDAHDDDLGDRQQRMQRLAGGREALLAVRGEAEMERGARGERAALDRSIEPA